MKRIKLRKLVCASLFIIGYTIQVEAQTNEYFKTTWNTQAGDPGNATIKLPITVGAYDVDVNNDGDFDDAKDKINQRGTITIYFGYVGIHTIAVRPNPTNNASKRLGIRHLQAGTPQKLMSIDKWGDIVWTSMAFAFEGCSNMTFADNVGVPDLSMVTSMSFTFQGATNFNGDISNWNVSNVTNMQSTFDGASSFNGNISTWNVSNVTNMRQTFDGATNFNGNISTWDVSNVTSIRDAFKGATSFNGDLSTWNVSNVTYMGGTFGGATSFNGDLSSWNVSNVIHMGNTFSGASSFNGDLSSWNVSNITDMRNTFRDATSFNGNISTWNVSNVRTMWNTFNGASSFNGNISNWNVSNVTNMFGTFANATSFNGNISTLNVSNVTNMRSTFLGATSFNQDISTWNVSNVTSMDSTFSGATSFSSENYDALLQGWSARTLQPNVAFRAPSKAYCSGETGRNILTNTYNWTIEGDTGPSCPLPFVTTWNAGTGSTISLPIIQGRYDADTNNDGTFDMINRTGSLNVNLSAGTHTIKVRPNTAYNTEKNLIIRFSKRGATPEKLASINKWGDIVWTSMERAFQSCNNLMSIASDAGVPDLSMVTDMSNMFNTARRFNADLNGWDVSNVTNMASLFSNALAFNSDISNWNVSNVTNMNRMFRGGDGAAFNSDISGWDVSAVTDMAFMFAYAENFNQDLNGWGISSVTDMTNMLVGTSFSRENYNALLVGWSALPTLVSGITFGAPPTTYCAGEAGRDILINTYNWDITGDMGLSCPAPFVTTWEVADDGNTATTDDLSITIPINSDFTYAYTVDWGDGTIDATTYMGDATYTYSAAGTYTVSISGDFPAIYFNNDAPEAGDNSLKIKTIKSWGAQRWLSLAGAFRGCQNLTTIEDNAGVPDLTMVTDMGESFSGASSFNGDLSTWNVSNVSNMAFTFSGASSFNGDLSTWNVSNVTDMFGTFDGATSFNGNISNWNVSNVASMRGTFYGASSFNGDLSTWNVSNVTDMFGTFDGATNFNSDLSSWDVSKVTTISQAFFRAASFTSDLSSWNVSKVTNMRWTFSRATSFTSDLSSWNVSNVTSMSNTFNGASSFNQDLSTWNVSNVASMRGTFNGASSFNQDLSSWNVSNVTNMMNTFANASSFNQDLSNWGVPNVTNMVGTFFNATSFNQDLSSWNVSNVTLTAWMFSGATSFNSDLSTWNVSNVTDMNNKFSGATNFNSDLSSWDVSNVFYLTDMLTNATSFSSENYDALLTGWSSLPTLRTGVPFGAPPTTYCAGEAGRNILTSVPHNWVISGDSYQCSPLTLSIDAFLQGSYNTTTSIMNASLLTANNDANIIPTESPYGDGATVESTVFNTTTGDDAIVDWVEISLHDPNDVSVIISSTSALLQKDGDVVALDGSSAVQIQGVAGDYKVSINHRNHLPVITDATQSLSATETAIDFTNDLTIVTGGSNAMSEVATGVYALFSGDVNQNGQVQVDDYNAAIQDVGRGGYLTSDVDMNGELQVSDINFVLKTLGKGAQF